jgi:hypothetical protein
MGSNPKGISSFAQELLLQIKIFHQSKRVLAVEGAKLEDRPNAYSLYQPDCLFHQSKRS